MDIVVDRSWWMMLGSSFTAEQQQPTVTVHGVVIITSFLLTITVTGLHSVTLYLCILHSQRVLSRFTAPGKVGLAMYSPAQPRLRLLMGWIKIIIY